MFTLRRLLGTWVELIRTRDLMICNRIRQSLERNNYKSNDRQAAQRQAYNRTTNIWCTLLLTTKLDCSWLKWHALSLIVAMLIFTTLPIYLQCFWTEQDCGTETIQIVLYFERSKLNFILRNRPHNQDACVSRQFSFHNHLHL